MPILGEQVSLFPEWLLEDDAEVGLDRAWWVLYTKSRQEKAVARNLLEQEIPFYLPLVKKRSLWRGRKMVSYVPVFANYVFLCANQMELAKAWATNRVVRALAVSDGQRLRNDLHKLQISIASGKPLTVEAGLTTGMHVRVKHGPLAGLEGTVLTRRGETRLFIAVNFLKQGVSIEIEDYLLEPI
jgi:transcription antitermination factor NusG